jgi:hypothetical protein
MLMPTLGNNMWDNKVEVGCHPIVKAIKLSGGKIMNKNTTRTLTITKLIIQTTSIQKHPGLMEEGQHLMRNRAGT